MRVYAFLITFLFSLSLFASDVSGTVEVILKGDNKKTDLSSVIVYLDAASPEFKVPAESVKKNYSMETKNKQITPHVLAVPSGAGVQFPNFDSIYHNLFSVSAPNQFDLGIYKGGDSKTQVFQNPGIVKVFCNVHPQMSATIVVSTTPYSTVADAKGNFDLGQIPGGVYDVKAYSDEGQTTERIQVGDVPQKVQLTIDARNFKKLRHKNKFGKDYSTNEDERY
jgi:plastocyanin